MDYAALLKERGFSDEEIKTLLPRLEPAFSSIATTRQSEIDTLLSDLSTKESKLNEDMAEWASMTAAEKAAAGDVRQALDDSKSEVYRLEQKITRLAEDLGRDPKEILGHESKPPEKKVEPVFDSKPLLEQVGQSINYVLRLATDLPAIADEYRDLTGKKLDTRAFRAEIEKRAKTNKDIDPQTVADELFNLPTLRTEKQTKDQAEQRLQYIEEGRQLERTESALPPGHSRPADHNPGPIFNRVRESGSKLQRPQPGDRVSRALASAVSGKYKNGAPETKTA